jgi:hypothetical protein
VAARSVKVASRRALWWRNHIKTSISVGYVSKVRRIFIAGEHVVPTSQTPGRAGLQGNGSARLLGAISLRRQRILKFNLLETARNRFIAIEAWKFFSIYLAGTGVLEV